MDNLQINGQRLWDSLMEMAKIGATEKGGVCRLALTDIDRAARDLFVEWCEEAGCAVTVDTMGNIFARRAGKDDSLAPVMTGSHIDSQPTGGRFDGIYGVLAGLEVIRTLNDFNYETNAPIEISAWTNEEGSRFAPAMTASGVFAGVFDLDYAHALEDMEGNRLGDELERIGYAGDVECGGREIRAFFEAHIEQGPILEAEEKTIGVVTAAQGQRWFEATVTGMEAHAGTTPMDRRKDALLAASRMVAAINDVALAHAPNAVTTVGLLESRPNSRNTIPGEIFFAIDCRNPDDGELSAMDREIRAACEGIAGEAGVTLALEEIWYFPPTPFDQDCVDAVRAAAEESGYGHRDIISGAGHDACYVSRVAPTGMIFIPCKDGISHNEIESATQEDCAAGCGVLLDAMVRRANA